MKTITNIIPNEKTAYFHTLFPNPSQVLLFDIETTGLSPKTASLYLIGCACFKDGTWYCRQFFASTPSSEKEILSEFCSFARNFSCLVTFNGTTFDIPFIQAKCKKYGLPDFSFQDYHDMYRMIRPYKNLLHLPGCRQKQLEEYIGLYREDPFTGQELISLYEQYGQKPEEDLLKTLLLHNFEDIQGMLELSCITAIPRLFTDHAFIVENGSLQTVSDAFGQTKTELTISIQLQFPLPAPLSCRTADTGYGFSFFSAHKHQALLKIPVFNGELKFFFKDYKNYSYLPLEDQAVHKSVAVFVDKTRRMPATAANCYIRKTGMFVPAHKELPDSINRFYPEYKSKLVYLEVNEEFLSDSELLKCYVSSLLKQMN
ncbi:MAG: ribonuclease H-like domain-containing protein [Lachnospiraceae bacterium]|nr:ribonuclease H-like domain-containing protein [Lachnospiraceae bacterium]